MPTVALRRGTDWGTVEIWPPADAPGLCAAIAHLAMTSGGEMLSGGFLVSTLTFRLFASELGAILQEHDARADYDSDVLSLLQNHVEEMEARRSASVNNRVAVEQIENALKKTRFNQVRKLKEP